MLTEEQKREIKKKLRKIELPIGLEYKLAQKIIERFDKAGLFYHYRSRIKAEKSIIHKFFFKSISEDHRIQDMIGIKFVFCFVDDLKIAEKIINEVYAGEDKNWTKTKDSTDGFSATKINGVFAIPPEYISDKTRAAMHDCYIDDTFEIQLKTMLFDGWHETDHDLRYKNGELWDMFPEMNRKLNRILATLELCDDSVISVFEKLTYRTYNKIKEESLADPDYKVDPLILERTALSRLRIKMKESFNEAADAYVSANIDTIASDREYRMMIMRDHFEFRFINMFLEKCSDKTEAIDKAEAFTDKVMNIFTDVRFLKLIIKYDRSKLIDNLLKYKNRFDIDIFSICALICTNPRNKNLASQNNNNESNELIIDEETISNLKRYLRRRYIERREARFIPVKLLRDYPTYQCHADIYPAGSDISTREVFSRVFLFIARWMDGKIGKDGNDFGNRKKLSAYANKDLFDFNEDIMLFENGGYDFKILYLKDYKNCAFRLVEPDNQYEGRAHGITVNRTFTTDISIRLIEKEGDSHIELAVRTSCKEPDQSLERAMAFRTGFIKRIFEDAEHMTIREHGIPEHFPWRGDGKTIYKTAGIDGDYKMLLESDKRQTPVVVIPSKAFDDPDFGVASLTSSLCGYGHVIVDTSSNTEDIRIYYPNTHLGNTDIAYDTISPDPLEDGNNNSKTYVYAWGEIYSKVCGYLIDRRDFNFGDVMLYRKLKDVYYESQEESVENLKRQIKNLKREINELKGQ